MVRYLFGILLGALLMLGFQHYSSQELQELRSQAVTATLDIQSATYSDCHISAAIGSDNCHSFSNEASNYRISDGLLGDFSSFRNSSVPSKILKYNLTAMKQLLRLPDTQLPENRWQGLSPDTNYIKYSNRYYVYTLGHILI